MADHPSGNRLLVIDDEKGYGQAVKRVAEGVGFEVTFTSDAPTFLNAARFWHPSVIMLDLKMPGTDGVQLLRALAADKCAAHIVLTSGAGEKIVESAIQLGRERGLNMAEPLPKPMRVEPLRERLEGYRRQALQAADIAAALALGQLFLVYQPKLDCRLGRITGAEALVRWQHPVRGLIPPDEFIGLAEESDVIHDVTDWVVAAAAGQAARWRAEGVAIEIAINISARDIEDIDLPDRLEQHCIKAGIDPAFLVLELTETGAMREAVQMMDVLTRLRLKGFRLSIDDFGTGYSSLVQLQKMPFSELKIDKSFVMQMQSNQGAKVIVEIVVNLARKLGLTSIAEGVEHREALQALAAMGCDMAQGYYLSRPIPAEQIPGFIRDYEAASEEAGARSRTAPLEQETAPKKAALIG